jgi:hypothetical protein
MAVQVKEDHPWRTVAILLISAAVVFILATTQLMY